MKLKKICDELMEVEEGMLYGNVNFTIDKLMMAMKCGHPAMIFDEMIAPVFLPVLYGETVSDEDIYKLLENLKSFKETFKVKELGKVIRHLEKYIAEQAEKKNSAEDNQKTGTN